MAFGFEMPIQSLLRSLSVVFGSEICCLSFGAAFVVLCFFCCCHCKSGASSAQNKEQQKPPLMFSFVALTLTIIILIIIPLDLRPKSSLVGFETGVWKGETTRTRRGENDHPFSFPLMVKKTFRGVFDTELKGSF
jgi:hypothetical protein